MSMRIWVACRYLPMPALSIELTAAGVPEDAITIDQRAADDPAKPMLEQAQQHDLVVGASKPSAQDVLFGTIPEHIVSNASVPVMVVTTRPEDASAPA